MRLSQSGYRLVLVVIIAAMVIGAGGCDGGAESKTPDDIAADSALAADLALANRDTLLVDSIGAYRAPGADDAPIADDTSLVDADLDPDSVVPVPATVPAASSPAPAAPAPADPPRPAQPLEPRQPRRPVIPATRRVGARACNSPTLADQSTCVRATLASTDMRLNRIYRALITEMRRHEGVARGAKDPPSVQRLRVAQRAWLVYRDNECRRRGRGKEGRLWARPRVKCLGEFSVRRANELADSFSRLTAS